MGAAATAASDVVEVVEVKGIIDPSVERTLLSVLERAEREDAAALVLQVDSTGAVSAARVGRIQRAIMAAEVPVIAWVGPARARAHNAAGLLVLTAPDVRAKSPSATVAGRGALDLRRAEPRFGGISTRMDLEASSIVEGLEEVDGTEVDAAGRTVRLATDPDDVRIRFHKLDIFGRILHAAAQPSITYLLLLLALVGIVFELFHPSTGPAGVSGLAALALSIYGVVTLGGSWLGVALIVLGVAGFALDLRFASLGPPTLAGLVALVAGSILLFNGPWLRTSPWILALGIAGMVAFLLGAMTRVLRDLRLIARGELEVQDAHPHPDGGGTP